MSTEVMNKCGNCLEEEFAEIILGECLDIVVDDEKGIDASDFAHYVIYLSKWLRVNPLVEDEYKGMKIKVHNCLRGYVSVFCGGCTGVSRTLYKPFPTDEEDVFGSLLNLAEMINEAWYNANNY